MPRADWLRIVLALVCFVSLFSAAVYIRHQFQVTPIQVHPTDYDVYRETTLQMIREESTSFLSIGVLVLGALWGTIIVNKENRLTLKRQDWPEIVMFVLSNMLLIMFLYYNWKYRRLLAQLYWDMGPLLSGKKKFADVLNSKFVLVHYHSLLICFYGGLALSGITVFSSCILRRRRHDSSV